MNTLFESRSALYWSAMNEYYRYFLLTSPANILKYIMCFVVAGGAVAEMIFLRDILNTANDIFLMVLCVVVALLVIVVSFTRYFSLKKGVEGDGGQSRNDNGYGRRELGSNRGHQIRIYRKDDAVCSDKRSSCTYVPERQLHCRGRLRNGGIHETERNQDKISFQFSVETNETDILILAGCIVKRKQQKKRFINKRFFCSVSKRTIRSFF